MTASGHHRPIRWLGHRTMDCRRHPAPQAAWPVRIAAQAFGPDRPTRDLYVSPGHAICVDMVGEVLVPAGSLINGATIVQVETDSVTYWHVELDAHDILLAEGLPAESYMDMGNRDFFVENAAVALAARPDAAPNTLADYCRPFMADGSLVEFVRERLRERAVGLGWTMAETMLGGLHLMVDGVRLMPDTVGSDARFVVPADAEDVWLVSDTMVPRHIYGTVDGRVLGVGIAALTIDDGLGPCRSIALDDPLLAVGFHAPEEGHRWTAGRARLPAALWAGCRGTFFCRLSVAYAAKRWMAPHRPASARGPVESERARA